MKIKRNDLLLYTALAVGGYFAVTRLLPWLAEKVGKTAGNVGAKVITGATSGGAAIITSAITAAPSAAGTVLRSVNEWTLSDDNILKPVGSAIGNWVYDVTHKKWLQR